MYSRIESETSSVFDKKKSCHTLWHGECADIFSESGPFAARKVIDVVVCSPPYNIGIKYGKYSDSKAYPIYLNDFEDVFRGIKRLLKDDGSFFLNVGAACNNPWLPMDVANIARKYFVLQNNITWVKSIAISDKDSHGHFRPINSPKYLNTTNEQIFHFTKDGNVSLDKLAIGVFYSDPSNVKRWKSKKEQRCRGNSWFIPYETIQNKSEKFSHPAIFPIELADFCIKLHGVEKTKLVMDPYCGAGSTLVAASRLGIDSYGIDIDEKYLDICVKRLQGNSK